MDIIEKRSTNNEHGIHQCSRGHGFIAERFHKIISTTKRRRQMNTCRVDGSDLLDTAAAAVADKTG